MKIDNKLVCRRYVRLQLLPPLKAYLGIENVSGELVRTRQKPVQVLDISPCGLKMTTNLNFPVSHSYELALELQILDIQLRLLGHIVWRQKEDNMFLYGISLHQTDSERMLMIRLLNDYLRFTSPLQKKIHGLYFSVLRNVSRFH